MDRRTTGIIATLVAVLLCGCPGVLGLFMGALFSVIAYIPGADIDVFGGQDPQAALNFGIGALCVGFLLLLIPVIVGVVTLRRRPGVEPPPEQPMPPTI